MRQFCKQRVNTKTAQRGYLGAALGAGLALIAGLALFSGAVLGGGVVWALNTPTPDEREAVEQAALRAKIPMAQLVPAYARNLASITCQPYKNENVLRCQVLQRGFKLKRTTVFVAVGDKVPATRFTLENAMGRNDRLTATFDQPLVRGTKDPATGEFTRYKLTLEHPLTGEQQATLVQHLEPAER